MSVGERIRLFRLRRGMTQKSLGMAIGFPEASADVRIGQYESGARKPKAGRSADMAQVLGVSPHALRVPDVESDIGLMHTLFALEDARGLAVGELDGEPCLRFEGARAGEGRSLQDMLRAWKRQADLLAAGKITREDYDTWRYTLS